MQKENAKLIEKDLKDLVKTKSKASREGPNGLTTWICKTEKCPVLGPHCKLTLGNGYRPLPVCALYHVCKSNKIDANWETMN